MRYAKKTAFATIWNSILSLFNQISALIVFALLARFLSVTEFSLVAFCLLIQRKNWNNFLASSCFCFVVALSIIFACITIFIIAPLSELLFQPGSADYLRVLSVVPLLTAIGFVSQAKLQRQFKNKELTLITGFSTALGMIVSLTLVLFSYGAWAIVIGRIVHSLLLAILLQKTELFLPTKVQIKKHHFKKIFSFCLPIFLQLVLYFVSARGVLLATLALLGNAQFAIMAIAQRAFRALSDVTATPLNAILLNSFSRLASLEQKQNAYEKVIRVSSAIIFPMFIGLALVSYEVVELAFGIKWKESSVLLSIMSFSILFMLPTWFLTSLLTSEGLTRQVLTMNIINATIIATSTLIGASFSLFHTALSLVFAEFILIFLKFWYVTRYLNLDTVSILKSLVPSLTSSLFMFFFVYVALIFMHSDISLPILLIIKIVLGIFSYSIFYLTFFNKSFTALKEELLPIFKK